MSVLDFFRYTMAIIVTVSLVLTVVFLIRGFIKKDYEPFKKYAAIYLVSWLVNKLFEWFVF